MSTKSSIFYDKESEFHLYQEGLDCWNVYLDIPLTGGSEITVAIPLRIWKEMRHNTLYMERYFDMSVEDLRTEAEKAVAERLRRYEEASERAKPITALAGCLTFGDINLPATEQVENYIEAHTPVAEEQSD